MRHAVIALLACSACGRFAFDPLQDSGDASVTDAPAAMAVTVGASVAECIGLTTPDPDMCRAVIGATRMRHDKIDQAFATTQESAVFLRFDAIPGLASDSIITDIVLTLTLTPEGTEDADIAGSVYAATCFTRADLFSGPPQTGALLRAEDGTQFAIPGDVAVTLPASAVTPGQPACFGLFASDTDGSNFWNGDGPSPPRLTVTFR